MRRQSAGKPEKKLKCFDESCFGESGCFLWIIRFSSKTGFTGCCLFVFLITSNVVGIILTFGWLWCATSKTVLPIPTPPRAVMKVFLFFLWTSDSSLLPLQGKGFLRDPGEALLLLKGLLCWFWHGAGPSSDFWEPKAVADIKKKEQLDHVSFEGLRRMLIWAAQHCCWDWFVVQGERKEVLMLDFLLVFAWSLFTLLERNPGVCHQLVTVLGALLSCLSSLPQ